MWIIEPRSKADKTLRISGSAEMILEIRYDDEPHDVIDAEAEKLVVILNDWWSHSYYSFLDDDDDADEIEAEEDDDN